MAGRTRVCTVSQALSNTGTLSVTNSIANITSEATSTLSRCSSSGTSPTPARPSSDSSATVR